MSLSNLSSHITNQTQEPRFEPRSLWLQSLNYSPSCCTRDTVKVQTIRDLGIPLFLSEVGKRERQDLKRKFNISLCIHIGTNPRITYVAHSGMLLDKPPHFSLHSQWGRSTVPLFRWGKRLICPRSYLLWVAWIYVAHAKSMTLSLSQHTSTITRHTQTQLAFITHPAGSSTVLGPLTNSK